MPTFFSTTCRFMEFKLPLKLIDSMRYASWIPWCLEAHLNRTLASSKLSSGLIKHMITNRRLLNFISLSSSWKTEHGSQAWGSWVAATLRVNSWFCALIQLSWDMSVLYAFVHSDVVRIMLLVLHLCLSLDSKCSFTSGSVRIIGWSQRMDVFVWNR